MKQRGDLDLAILNSRSESIYKLLQKSIDFFLSEEERRMKREAHQRA